MADLLKKCYYIERVPRCRFRSGENCERPMELRCIQCSSCGIVMLREEWERRGAIYQEYKTAVDVVEGQPILTVDNVDFYCSEHCRNAQRELIAAFGAGKVHMDIDGRLKLWNECFCPPSWA